MLALYSAHSCLNLLGLPVHSFLLPATPSGLHVAMASSQPRAAKVSNPRYAPRYLQRVIVRLDRHLSASPLTRSCKLTKLSWRCCQQCKGDTAKARSDTARWSHPARAPLSSLRGRSSRARKKQRLCDAFYFARVVPDVVISNDERYRRNGRISKAPRLK